MPSRRAVSAAAATGPMGATVGPEAMTRRSSPGTSDRISAVTGAPETRSQPPPFSRDSAWRTRFVCVMSAPEPSSSRFTSCFSASVTPATGAGSMAEPPPEISASTRSCGPAARSSASTSCAAASPAASGTGWPEASTRARGRGASLPRLVMTSASASGSASKAAAAMARAALPSAMTIQRPPAPGGSASTSAICAATPWPGSAAATPACSSAITLSRIASSSASTPKKKGAPRAPSHSQP